MGRVRARPGAMQGLRGRTDVVTGGANGVGFAMAERFAAEERP